MITKPKYVALVSVSGNNRSALKLDGDKYYRHAGAWSVGFTEKDGKLVAVGKGNASHLDGLALVEITREEWAKDNAGHI